MKHLRLWAALGIFGLLAAVGSVALSPAQNTEDQGFIGRSYVTTIKDSAGNFVSRGVITLHPDFPLETNPLGGGGTVIGTFTVVGELIKP